MAHSLNRDARTVLIEVTAATFGSNFLIAADLDVGDVLPIPYRLFPEGERSVSRRRQRALRLLVAPHSPRNKCWRNAAQARS